MSAWGRRKLFFGVGSGSDVCLLLVARREKVQSKGGEQAMEEKTKAELAKLQADTAAPSS